MNIDNISPSILHVTAKENLNIEDDLTKEATKTIAELINEKKEEMLQLVFQHEPKIKVATYEGLTVEYCKQIGSQYMIRGIRSASDFEYEKAISQMNQSMHPDIESVFIISRPGYSAISSTIVRDILRNGGDISQFVPKEITGILLGLK